MNNNRLTYLELDEIRGFLSSIDNARDKLLIRILYETGCSLIELTNIKIEDIAGNKIKIKEDKKIRFSRISGKLSKDIKMFVEGNKLKKDSYLISTRQSNQISEKRIRQLIQKYTKKYRQKINPQMFRYYHIAHAYQNGVFIENISNQLGITKYRIFQVLNELGFKPSQNHYNNFLRKI